MKILKNRTACLLGYILFSACTAELLALLITDAFKEMVFLNTLLFVFTAFLLLYLYVLKPLEKEGNNMALKGEELLKENAFLRKNGEYLDNALKEEVRKLGSVEEEYHGEIYEHKKTEKDLVETNRSLKVFSECNQALVRSNEESLLLHEICRIIVKTGGYMFAWVGFVKDDKNIHSIAQMGNDTGYLETILGVPSCNIKEGEPIYKAINTGKPCVVKDISAGDALWREQAIKRGYLSLIALPLNGSDKAFGTLSIYSHKKNAFNEKEEKLLVELASDVAYGVYALCTQSEKNKAKGMVRHLYYYDALTNLPNRILLQEYLTQEIRRAERNEEKLAVLFINIDGFNALNEMLGSIVGDHLLREIGDRLKNCLRKCDIIGKVGGDEFTVILPQVKRLENAARLAKRTLHAINSPFSVENNKFNITATVGVSIYPDDSKDVSKLFQNAATAMHHAKKTGKNAYHMYSQVMNIKAFEFMKLETCMREALEKKEFVIAYQPQVDISTGEITAIEALLRWRRSDGSVTYPMNFIPVAEETGLIIPIGEWVLRTVCEQNKKWQQAGYSVRVAVNLSARQLYQKVIVKIITKILKESGLEPKWLSLEITEDNASKNIEATKAALVKLHKMGVHIALDDFGTGYSSLNHLRIMPIDTVKVDNSFVSSIGSENSDVEMIKAIIDMAHNLNLKVLAEGVEKKEQLELLKKFGCDYFQGNFFSRPLPSEEIEKLLSAKVK